MWFLLSIALAMPTSLRLHEPSSLGCPTLPQCRFMPVDGPRQPSPPQGALLPGPQLVRPTPLRTVAGPMPAGRFLAPRWAPVVGITNVGLVSPENITPLRLTLDDPDPLR